MNWERDSQTEGRRGGGEKEEGEGEGEEEGREMRGGGESMEVLFCHAYVHTQVYANTHSCTKH